MKGPHSISLRLTIFVSLAVISGGILAWPFVVWTSSLVDSEEFASLNALGLNQAQYVVAQSLRRGSDGVAYVEATPGLGAYKKKNPNFRFAVFDGDSGSSLPGSDAESRRGDPVGKRAFDVPNFAAHRRGLWPKSRVLDV